MRVDGVGWLGACVDLTAFVVVTIVSIPALLSAMRARCSISSNRSRCEACRSCWVPA